jgi:hypothetical protein
MLRLQPKCVLGTKPPRHCWVVQGAHGGPEVLISHLTPGTLCTSLAAGQGQEDDAGTEQDAAHRPQLPRDHQARGMQNRNHAGKVGFESIMLGPSQPGCPSCRQRLTLPSGAMQGYIHKPGKIGIVSRSGTLTYEVRRLSALGDRAPPASTMVLMSAAQLSK